MMIRWRLNCRARRNLICAFHLVSAQMITFDYLIHLNWHVHIGINKLKIGHSLTTFKLALRKWLFL